MYNKIIISIAAVIFAALSASAQIGYQVAVIDRTKGEPKANTSVSVDISLTDNAGTVICSESRTETTDDFGIVSMTIGNASTFDNVDWSKLPLWVTAKVDGLTVSKTQVLSVPVAEHAKHTGTLTLDKLCSKTWTNTGISEYKYKFRKDMTFTRTYTGSYVTGQFCISGDMVLITYRSHGERYASLLGYMSTLDALVDVEDQDLYK